MTGAGWRPSAGGLVAVTYAVRNVLGPEARPEIAAGADVTATMDAILAANFAADANSIRGAALVLELTEPQSAFHSASLPIERDGAALAVNLGDVPPLGERRVTITVTTPAATANFVELDVASPTAGRRTRLPKLGA